MGQIRVEKNVGGIEGLCVITPAVHGDARGYAQARHERRAAVSDAAGRVSVPVYLGNAGAVFLPV